MQQKEEQKSMPDDETKHADFWTIILLRKTMIIALCVVSVLATMIVSLLLPKYYQSQAMVLAIAPESGGLGAALSASPLAGALSGSVGGLSSPADRLLVFLKSRTIAEMVVTRFDLLRVVNQDKWDPVKGAWKEPEKPPLMEDAVKYLGKKMTQFKKSREGTITITVEWKDPKLAADIANYYVAALAEFMKDKSINTTVQIIDRAVPAGKKSSPKISQNMMTAGLISLMIGVFLALVLEKRDKRSS
jgi:tyrosine-protein kinase Etk/Wzc